MSRFSEEEIRRYGRQMILREVGGRGQERLRAARLTLRAVGAAGAVAADYLARAGVAVSMEAAGDGPSLLRDAGGDVLLFAACQGPVGEVGPGCPCGAADELRGADGTGAAAFLTGSLLALEALKRLLDLPEALRAGVGAERRVLRVDLRGDAGVGIGDRPALACRCAPAPASC